MLLAAAGPAEGAALARFFPGQDLVVYAEFDGLDAHAEHWRTTAAYRLLNETTAGAMLEDLVTQLADRALASSPGARLSGAELLAIVEHAGRSGFAFGIVRKPTEPRPSCIGLVLRGAARGNVRGPLNKLINEGAGPGARWQVVDKPGGRKVMVVGGARSQGLAWWSEGDDLAISLGTPRGVDVMIETLDTDRPDASGNPTRADLVKAEDGFTPVGVAFFDMAALPALPPQAVKLGLDRIRRIDYRWGFQGDALMTFTRVVAPAPREGVLALLDQPTFDRQGLLPMPAGLVGFTAFSIDPDALYGRLAEVASASDPKGRASFDAFERAVRQATGLRLREEILSRLGPRMTYYAVPSRIIAPTNPLEGLAQGLVHTPRASLAIELKDAASFAKVLDDLVASARAMIRAQAKGPDAPAIEFRTLKGVEHGYVLSVPPSAFPLPAGLRPTIVLGQKTLIIGTTPETARAALALEGRDAGLPDSDPLARTVGRLPGKMVFANVNDTRQSLLPDVIANLPNLIQLIGTSATNGVRPPFLPGPRRTPRVVGKPPFQLAIDADKVPAPDDLRPFLFPALLALTVDDEGIQFISRESFPGLNPAAVAPVAVALLLPAVQASRSAARRAQSVNNLKQIGLALHNYHSVNDRFPPGATTDKAGKPLLSWRVAILPFIEQNGLFNEFKLDEPWDSPHNKALLERMPATYAVPGSEAEPGMTFYRGFSGEHALFDPKVKDGVKLPMILDGTSNTIGIVEAKEAVPWTKPDEEIPFEFSPKLDTIKEILPKLGGHFPGGFDALFLDGSVRFIKQSINLTTLQALITRDAGEVVSADSF
jgi:hypothetical protein